MSRIPTEEEVRHQLLSACPVLAEILATGRTKSPDGEDIPTSGVSTIRNLVALRRLMELGGFDRTLEIGLAHGASAMTITSMHKELGHPPTQQHVAIDPYQNGYLKGAGLAAMARADLSAYLEHVQELSQTTLPRMFTEGRKFGLIYIDGSHSFDDAFVDFYFSDALLAEGGYIVFDDCGDVRVRKVTRFVQRNYSIAYKEVLLPTLLQLINPLRHQTARYLGKNQVQIFQRVTSKRREWDSPLVPF